MLHKRLPVAAGRLSVKRVQALVLAGLGLAASIALGTAEEAGDTLLPGQVRERSITAGETHTYRITVTDLPLAITVEQKGSNLVVEAVGPASRSATDLGERWGPEVLLLETAGEYQIAVRPREKSPAPGRYAVQAEALPAADTRRAAFSLMSRAGQEAFEGNPEAKRNAVASCREALAAWRALDDHRWEAETLSIISGLEHESRDLRAAKQDYLRALALWRELAEPRREAAILNDLGVTLLDIGEVEAAREYLRNALSSWRQLPEPFDEAETLSNLCYVDLIGGALPAALTCFEESLALYRRLGVRHEEARILNNLGGVHDVLGEPDAALDSLTKALEILRELEDKSEEARTLGNIAAIRRALGEWQESLRLYGRVRELQSELGDRSREASLLSNLGFTYNSLGEPQRALSFLETALKLRRDVGDRRGELITLNNLGSTWRKLGDLKKAFAYHSQALQLTADLEDHRQEAVTRLRLSEVRLEQGDPNAALRELEPALGYLKETGIRQGELQALQLRGRAFLQAGRLREARPVFQEVLERQRTLRNRTGEAEALQALAAAERSLGLAEESRVHADQAVTLIEELRTGFVSPDLRAAFLATQRRAYSLLTDLLMDRHAAEPGGTYAQAALGVNERARARSLLDVLYSGNSVRPGSGVPGELLERRRSLRYRLSAKTDQQVRKRNTGEETEAQEREIQALLTQLDSVEAEIRRLDPHYAAVAEPRSISVADIAKLIDSDTLLLEYSLGEERSYLWAVGAGVFRSFVLPKQQEIEKLARQLYDELSTLDAGPGQRDRTASQLREILLGEVWPDVARSRRLIVVPDAALHLVPFGALPAPDSGKPLLERLEIAYLPSATTLALQRQRLEHRAPATKLAAVLADPVFAADDPRLVNPSGPRPQEAERSPERGASGDALFPVFERLPASQHEAKEIARLAPAGQVQTLLNLAANREAVISGELGNYRILHFATHGVANTLNPERSGLVLSLVDSAGRPKEGFLGLSDIYELDLRADLVVLSGCQTALGREVQGEGIMGLTRGFLYAGVPRVVASLWRVQDRATAELMSRFYRALWQDGLPAAAALRQAQQSLRHDPRYRDPYSWAGFVIQGDWR